MHVCTCASVCVRDWASCPFNYAALCCLGGHGDNSQREEPNHWGASLKKRELPCVLARSELVVLT